MRKPLLKSLVAAAAVSLGLLFSACVAMADTTTTYYWYKDTGSASATNTDTHFSFNGSISTNLYVFSGSETSTYSFAGETQTHTPAGTIKLNKSGYVNFEVKGTGSLEFIWSPKQASESSVQLQNVTGGGSTTVDLSGASSNSVSAYTRATVSGLTSGNYKISRSTGENYIYGIKLTDVVDSSITSYDIQVGEKDNDSYPNVTVSPTSTTIAGSNVTVSWEASGNYRTGSKVVTLSDSMLTDTTYTIPYSAFSDAFSEKLIFSAEIDASTQTSGTYKDSAFTSVGPYIGIVSDGSSSVNIDDANYKFTDINGKEISTSKRIDLGGSGSTTKRAVKFHTNTAGSAYIYTAAGGTGRTLVLSDGSTTTNIAAGDSAVKVSQELSLSADTDYYLYSAGSGISILYLQYTGTLSRLDTDIAKGEVFSKPTVIKVDENTYYAIALIPNDKATDETIEYVSLSEIKTDIIAATLNLDGFTSGDYGVADYYAGFTVNLGSDYSGEKTATGVQTALGEVSFVNYTA